MIIKRLELYFCLYFTLFLSITANAQKNRCYLYLNERDCINANAGIISLREIAVGLEPTVVFGNMSKEEAELGAKEIFQLISLTSLNF